MEEKHVVIAETNKPVTTADFDTDEKYEALKETVLVDGDGYIVIPVRRDGAPHFRRLVGTGDDVLVGAREDDETHTRVIRFLTRLLNDCKGKVRIRTRLFKDNTTDSTLPILAAVDGGLFQWLMEGKARIYLDESRYIQPDIAGRHSGWFIGRPSQPSIVIEVVRTHVPDFEAFRKLLDLSRAGHMVVLFFANWHKWGSVYSQVNTDKKPNVELVVSHYLHGGEFHRCGKAKPRLAQQSDEAYYDHIKSTYLTPVLTNLRVEDEALRDAEAKATLAKDEAKKGGREKAS